MKVIDTYKFYKEKYREYVVLIKSGIFYEVYNNDVSIMYSLFHYKIRVVGNNFNVGFPINNIGNICKILDDNNPDFHISGNQLDKILKNNV